MDPKVLELYEEMKGRGLSEEDEQKILRELRLNLEHEIPDTGMDTEVEEGQTSFPEPDQLYEYNDLSELHHMSLSESTYSIRIRSIDELLERDKKREEDGFPRKIRIGRLIRPGKGGKDKIVIVPTTVEEKLIHDTSFYESDEPPPSGGTGEGKEGEVIGEEPVRKAPQKGGAGQGEDGSHEMESSAYDLGRILTEKFKLPNLKDKGKKRSLTRYTYDMTDKHQGFGQLIDKKATLRKILETNIHLGNMPDVEEIDPTRFLISPSDKIYRILSREKDYESQAMVFFLRDYSGSMSGKPTELVVAQHVLIYSWILYQYARQVETRFVLHDTEAKEVPDFYSYYNSTVAGGTRIASAYRLVNEIVRNENLVQDYNIYVFHGTDGDDWDKEGREALPELEKMLAYANRVGITVAKASRSSEKKTEVENYLSRSALLKDKPSLIRMDVIREDADEARLIQGIKNLIS